MIKTIAELRRDIHFDTELAGHHFSFSTTWGLFSPRAVDAGSRLLVEHISVQPNARILDIGCGYGAIGLALARCAPHGSVDLVDTNYVAVAYAQKNAEQNHITNCHIFLSNLFSEIPKDMQFDHIVSNVPAKAGNELFTLLLLESFAHLSPGGTLSIVSLSGLKEYFKRTMKEIFGNYEKIKQGSTYTVAQSVK